MAITRAVFATAAPLTALLGIGFLRWRFLIVKVNGTSMEPSLSPGQKVLARRGRNKLRRGDVLIIRIPLAHRFPAQMPPRVASDEWLIKRLVALEGDEMPPSVPIAGTRLVPEGMIVVLGDAAISLDSETWGCIPAERVVGVMLRRLSA